MDLLLHHLTTRTPDMLKMLRQFVEAESPSTDKAAVDHLGALVIRAARAEGCRVRTLASQTTGNHLRIEFTSRSRTTKGQILLLGHLDTVWPLGTLAKMPFRISNGRAHGPGVFDMKSGIVIALFAIAALQNAGIGPKKRIVLLLNADEEIGSPSSRRWTEAEARRSECVLVVEPAQGLHGALKTARKGVGEFEIRVTGRSAHAGIEPHKGASAVSEVATQILYLESLTDYSEGLTINAGRVRGGTRSNVIPADASATMDVRVQTVRDAQRIERLFRKLRPFDRRTRVHVSGGFNRPPMERSASTAALFEKGRRLARPLGIRLTETAVGGGSDGNFTAALGVPTLDGLGAVGDGAHAAHEHIVVSELPRRAALLAHLIRDLAS